jgi:hypothetical protein
MAERPRVLIAVAPAFFERLLAYELLRTTSIDLIVAGRGSRSGTISRHCRRSMTWLGPRSQGGDTGSNPVGTTLRGLFELGREKRGAKTSENSARAIFRSFM